MVRMLPLALVVCVGAVEASAGQRAMRFANMDDNGDGVITRREWRGNARAFDAHDWNRDGILSGDEVRQGARRNPAGAQTEPWEPAAGGPPFSDWTAEGFERLDDNGDGRIARAEWRFDAGTFRRADRDGSGWLSRAEFLGEVPDARRADRVARLDTNGDGRVSRAEWNGTAERFRALDRNRDNLLTRDELRDGAEPPPDLFASVDADGDDAITRAEWRWSRASFDARDANRDGRLTRDEFGAADRGERSDAWQRGEQRGLVEGRQAGKEDRQAGWGWDLDGQRELESADSGYDPRFGSREDYQAGYRAGFTRGYKEGFGPRN